MRDSTASTMRSSRVAFGLGGARTKCAQIIGVTVTEMTVDTAMANTNVRENSRNSRPTMPPMNSSGMNAAISEMLIETTVKPICLAPSMVARSGEEPPWPEAREWTGPRITALPQVLDLL